ncbi:TPA: N-acetylneuraminate synthase [Citrobacter sedlakii]|nr:N-acetylneuraminate synthase [Citrobacter sedlakii]EKX8507936.1 N-acetylneuraminate synthase [Citrobacter sedlakii]HCA7077530.1 N-acetylneuraminate synthase [Citrobacter sedlakii]HCA7081557.1 N-acetylneuraminate synthase [Citrobacter sedlakii]HCA7134873.1 N-acetylneuraminate synthase [Citrobacter sedlakii]
MTLIIAEAGVNHNGDEKLAFELVEAAFQAGADCIKFQTFNAQNLVTAGAKMADYQVANTRQQESQLSMLSRLELSPEAHHALANYCQYLGIEFLSSAFDIQSLHFLSGELGLKRLKLSSGELTNAPLVLAYARTGCDILVSTGMASLAEVEAALGVLAFGYTASPEESPGLAAFEQAWRSVAGQQALKRKVTLLHCTTDYPAPLDEINLRAMDTLSAAFDLPVGYSDHSAGIVIPVAAAARGARIIEKHVTLDKNLPGPDHKASLTPDELGDMVNAIRQVDRALGSKIKAATASEIKNKDIVRKSVVATQVINPGDAFTAGNISTKRPGGGMSPYMFWELLQQTATQYYQPGDLINE